MVTIMWQKHIWIDKMATGTHHFVDLFHSQAKIGRLKSTVFVCLQKLVIIDTFIKVVPYKRISSMSNIGEHVKHW